MNKKWYIQYYNNTGAIEVHHHHGQVVTTMNRDISRGNFPDEQQKLGGVSREEYGHLLIWSFGPVIRLQLKELWIPGPAGEAEMNL